MADTNTDQWPPTDLSHALEIDHALTEMERDINLLLNLTPVNASEAWADFERGGFASAPAMQSRPLSFEPDLVKRRLYDLEIERVEDPALENLFLAKRDEIMREIMLLEDRDTSRFMYGSLQLFGDVGEALVADATELLEKISVSPPRDSYVTAAAFAETAQQEIDSYRARHPGFTAELEVRSDLSDLMVSHGRFLVPASAVFRSRRVNALIQHEVGTHVVTYENGRAQPLKLLAVGLPGYDETQEGLALLAEFVCGGLDPLRLRLLAARVVAVDRLINGAEFLEIFKELREEHALAPKTAWGVTIRIARNGGLTKDVIYLRGISRLLEFISERKTIEPLLVGKLSLDNVPLIEELIEREILQPARIRPRWTEGHDARRRLERAYEGMRVRDLIEGSEAA
ncbi:MAG: DUF1704 domain-containing protein [Actinobacteria bacterium]|jgi:uncharacterized protein (TIGR02421 family)|nr:DUF1704 domain-containing protein [Actinomycetota bacterium]